MSPRPAQRPRKYVDGEYYPGRDIANPDDLVEYLAREIPSVADALRKSDNVLEALSEIGMLRQQIEFRRQETDKAARVLTEYVTKHSLIPQAEVAKRLHTSSVTTVTRWRFNPFAMPRPQEDSGDAK